MEERQQRDITDDGIDHREYIAVFRKVWWKIVLFSLAVGLVTLIVMFQLPNMYQATAVITPPTDEKKQNSALGALASFGIDIGRTIQGGRSGNALQKQRPHRAGLQEIQPLADRPGGQVRSETGKVKTYLDGSSISVNEKEPKAPGDWDAIRAVKDRLKVTVNKKVGTVILLFESPSPRGSAEIVRLYLEEGKSRLQEEAFERANRNKKFIEDQIGRTVDTLTRDRLYTLFGQEVEREMMARNREQFGFREIDSPMVPDRKSRPARAKGVVAATLLTFFGLCGLHLARGSKRKES